MLLMMIFITHTDTHTCTQTHTHMHTDTHNSHQLPIKQNYASVCYIVIVNILSVNKHCD